MNQTVVDAINGQINAEFRASYTYLAMSAFCERQHFRGAARWLRFQSQEEYGHAMKLLDFLLARGGEVELREFAQPPQRYQGLLDVFEQAMRHEQEVTRQIDALYELAFREKAYATTVELQWFLMEQVEEEKSSSEIVAKLRLVKDDPASLLDIDRELGMRSTAE